MDLQRRPWRAVRLGASVTLGRSTTLNWEMVLGRAKDEWIEVEERGWYDVDAFVCAQCVDDPFLKALVSQDLCDRTCSYCHRTSAVDIAAPFAIVMGAVASTVLYYFRDPTLADVPWDDGESLIRPTDTEDALNALPLACNDDLFIAIANAFHNDAWVPAAYGHWASSHRRSPQE